MRCGWTHVRWIYSFCADRNDWNLDGVDQRRQHGTVDEGSALPELHGETTMGSGEHVLSART